MKLGNRPPKRCTKLSRSPSQLGRNPMLIGADLQRPAAVEQLRTLGGQIDVPVFSEPSDPVAVAFDEDCRLFVVEMRGYSEDRDKDLGQIRLLVDVDGDTVKGITVMAVEPTEAVFVNVIGDLNPAELEKVMDNFDVDID